MGHQAPDGIILVFGGADADGVAFSTSWLFDPGIYRIMVAVGRRLRG